MEPELRNCEETRQREREGTKNTKEFQGSEIAERNMNDLQRIHQPAYNPLGKNLRKKLSENRIFDESIEIQ